MPSWARVLTVVRVFVRMYRHVDPSNSLGQNPRHTFARKHARRDEYTGQLQPQILLCLMSVYRDSSHQVWFVRTLVWIRNEPLFRCHSSPCCPGLNYCVQTALIPEEFQIQFELVCFNVLYLQVASFFIRYRLSSSLLWLRGNWCIDGVDFCVISTSPLVIMF